MNVSRPRRGYALATILILLAVCMFGAAALVTISILESKISRSELEGTIAYYAAEAGIKDAVWRLNNVSTYNTPLNAGTLNATYSVTDKPAVGQGFTVTLLSLAQSNNAAQVDVIGTSNNGNFTATRHIRVTVFQGDPTPSFGAFAFLAGGATTVTNGSSALLVNNGDFYSRSNITINSATFNAGTYTINAMGNYTANNSTVTSGGIFAANRPPAPSAVAVPGYNFAQYSGLPTNRCTAGQYNGQAQLRCSPAQFQALIGSSNNFTFNNSVVYIDAATTFNSWVRNKTITFNGLLVINGNFTVNSAATNFAINTVDIGSHRSGVIAAGDINNSMGTWNINGVYYSSGNSTFTNTQSISVTGAVIAGGAVSINTGASLTMNYDGTVPSQIFGGTPTAVQVLHWEEEY